MPSPSGYVRFYADTLRNIYNEVGINSFAVSDLECLSDMHQKEKSMLFRKYNNLGFLIRVSRRDTGLSVWRLSPSIIEVIKDPCVVQV